MKFFRNLVKKAQSEPINEQVIHQLGFSNEIVDILNQTASKELYPLHNHHEVLIGLSFNCTEERAESVVRQLRETIQPLGYLPFISDKGFGQKNKTQISIVKTGSQFELLRILETNGENYDVSNEDVILKLSEWHKRYPFTITGANIDWVEMDFNKLPGQSELLALAKEMVEFCPDVVEDPEDEESVVELIEEMKETKSMGFWWD